MGASRRAQVLESASLSGHVTTGSLRRFALPNGLVNAKHSEDFQVHSQHL